MRIGRIVLRGLAITLAGVAFSVGLARLGAGSSTDVARAGATRAVTPGRIPLDRVAPGGYAAPSTARVSRTVREAAGRLLVKFDDDATARIERRVLASADADVEERVAPLDVAVVEVAPGEAADAAASLESSPHVDYVERDSIVRALATVPNDRLWGTQWGLQLLDLPGAWQAAKTSAGVTVAVLDSGVDGSHPDLAGIVGAGVDLVNGDADASDDNGHGTSAAGVIAALADNGVGGAGVCRSCAVLPVKVLDAGGVGTTSLVAEGIVWAADHGARVISMSLGSPSSSQALTDAVGYARAKGVLLVAAAGNAGTFDRFYPAADPTVVSVAATNPADALYEWSNRGSWVRLAAPGCNTAPTLGATYVSFCGTSSAAPIVAGLAGLAISQDPGIDRDTLERALASGTVPVTDVASGRVNARSTLAALGATAPPTLATRTVRGSLSARRPAFRIVQRVGAGRVGVVLRSSSSRLRVAVVDARGRTVARASGRSVLRISRALPAGAYRLVVSGRAAARFALVLTYPSTPEVPEWLDAART